MHCLELCFTHICSHMSGFFEGYNVEVCALDKYVILHWV